MSERRLATARWLAAPPYRLKMLRMLASKVTTLSRAAASVGIGLMAIGLGAFVFSANRFGYFYSLGANYESLFFVIGVGIILSFVNLIVWAVTLDKKGRAVLGVRIVLGAIATCLFGSFVGGTNVHGPFFIVFFAMIPILAVGLIVLLMAAAARRVA